ncbi:hypothetical protein E2C01_065831 [Portunus trituberculatus]|uniref:Uncharacterized protein n=1 Tax=Portunus trituberculatus TaxID=210409 RepID=A0A5B7HN60_PORTR|nr:hypothetical protein [Portunus trituberculatus]
MPTGRQAVGQNVPLPLVTAGTGRRCGASELPSASLYPEAVWRQRGEAPQPRPTPCCTHRPVRYCSTSWVASHTREALRRSPETKSLHSTRSHSNEKPPYSPAAPHSEVLHP